MCGATRPRYGSSCCEQNRIGAGVRKRLYTVCTARIRALSVYRVATSTAPVRLSATHIAAIRDVVLHACGPGCRVLLFGSRLDGTRRGGDVDLLVQCDQPVERPALLSAQLSALISRRLGGRAVDVVLDAPNLQRSAIHRIAEQQGQEL